ncbi:MAG: carbohydrate binding domain-containing protein, partial [Phycisphaerae bacterium]
LCYGDTNVLTNPGFESGTSGWSARSCSISTVTSPVRSGTYSGRAYSRTETWNGIQQNMMDKMVIGATYTISGWVRISGTSSATVTVTIQKTDSSNNGEPTYTNVASVTANNSGWTELSGDYTLNVTGTLVELNVYFEGPASGIDIYVDDAVVYGPEPGGGGSEASGTVDINTRHQEIEGFGAAVAWYENWLWSHQNANELYDLLFDELGLDIYRVRNTYNQGTGGTEYMSNTEDIVAAAKLRNPNLKILISSWTPPASLKSNSSLSGGGDATLAKSGGAFRYTDFANWWADSITAWAGYGVNADYISIQNEPDYDASWDSCRFDPTENTDIAGYNVAFEAVYNELNSRFGSSIPKMLAPEATGFYGASGHSLHNYLTAIISHSNVYGYCHHLYNINAGDNPDNYISSMNSFYSSWGSKPLFQTEYEKSTDVWPDAYNLALLLHNSLTVENVSGYIYWDLVWNNGGLVTLPSYGASTYTINSDFYGLKHYSAFTDPNWQRVEAVSDSPDLRMTAFISPENDLLSVIIVNTSEVNNVHLDLNFIDNPNIRAGDIYRTSSSENCVFIGEADPFGSIELPANTITTVVFPINAPPVSDAGPDQDVFAYIDGFAEVNLDGSGSYDDDGGELSYCWKWTIGDTEHQAQGVKPTITLPVGQHIIELITDNGFCESEPDYCTVKVIEPLQSPMWCVPGTFRDNANRGLFLVIIPMPQEITKEQINISEPLIFYPGEAKARLQRISVRRCRRTKQVYIYAWFRRTDCWDMYEPGLNMVTAAGQLHSGQCFQANGYVWFIPRRSFNWWSPLGYWGCVRK